MSPPRVLVVDDQAALSETLARGLTRRGFEVTTASSGPAALASVGEDAFDAVLSDVAMQPMSGLALCEQIRAVRPDLPVILMTAFGSMETAIDALRRGAYDFLQKPVDVDLAAHALRRAVELKELRGELKRLREATPRAAPGGLVGESVAMREILDTIGRVAGSDATVLVTGESGVGKELVARALHEASARVSGPFVAVNLAALPDSLLESELFGHAKGAFTDARAARTGLFVQADGGTLFLDEVGEMPAHMQSKLLRALQERRVRPVGADGEVPFDARIVAATNRDLLEAVERGAFREDLYFRLAVIELEVPPLRDRGGDVLPLADRILRGVAQRANKPIEGFDPEAARALLRYRWPGNVRELVNCVERAVALARFDRITVDDLPRRIREFEPQKHVLVSADDPGDLVPLEEVERRYILRVLDAVGGRRAQAAKILGLDRKTLYRKLERWGHGEPDGA
ncbi:MAG: sigma-54-dependent Fis family transcriptional regulator [Sandaracinaceae bacterium]|nr:sigma-54-dependent Fis family transcriptional regulator [Sandaracinaceae bacterium]